MIGELFKSHRYKHGFGMRIMARVLGVSVATYCRIEQGKEISQSTMVKLINYLFKVRPT